MLAIKKLNNNAVLCRDGQGRDVIAMGRGVGFGGDFPRELPLSKIEHTFYDIDPKVREDWKNGLCDLGIMREEPQIKVPKKLLQELIAVRDPEKPISEKLQKLIRQMMVVKKALSRK